MSTRPGDVPACRDREQATHAALNGAGVTRKGAEKPARALRPSFQTMNRQPEEGDVSPPSYGRFVSFQFSRGETAKRHGARRSFLAAVRPLSVKEYLPRISFSARRRFTSSASARLTFALSGPWRLTQPNASAILA
jgi:hypothetical protein